MNDVHLLPHLEKDVVKGVEGFKLDSYLVALEGWRRGLTLKWYKDETTLCKIKTFRGSTYDKLFSLSSAKRTHEFYRSRGDKVANRTVNICQNKEKTKSILSKKGISTPEGDVFNINDKNITTYADDIGYPVVIKPPNGSMGKGVYTNITNHEELEKCLEDYRSRYNDQNVIVEKHYVGNEYRIYVVGDYVVGATNRIPANVIGDGVSNIKQLISGKNIERKKNPYLAPKPIKPDYEINQVLEKSGYNMNTIPPENEMVMLREKSNLSSGGDPIDATDELSREIKQLAVDTLKVLPSIKHGGVDIIVDPQSNDKGVVLEVNATAEIAFHMFPIKGSARDIPKAIIDYYFPETKHIKPNDYFFDFRSILDPLKNWSVEELTVIENPMCNLYGRKFIISGKIRNVGYMNWIRNQALKKGFHGYARKLIGGKVEVVVFGKNDGELDNFKGICYKGSKQSVVNNVEEVILQNTVNFSIKLGFELRL